MEKFYRTNIYFRWCYQPIRLLFFEHLLSSFSIAISSRNRNKREWNEIMANRFISWFMVIIAPFFHRCDIEIVWISEWVLVSTIRNIKFSNITDGVLFSLQLTKNRYLICRYFGLSNFSFVQLHGQFKCLREKKWQFFMKHHSKTLNCHK